MTKKTAKDFGSAFYIYVPLEPGNILTLEVQLLLLGHDGIYQVLILCLPLCNKLVIALERALIFLSI